MNQERYQLVKDQLIKWNKAYFLNDELLFAEEVRDQLKKELLEIEKIHPKWIDQTSPSQNIGYGLAEKFQKHKHLSKKYSLQDCFDITELKNFYARANRKLQFEPTHFIPLSIEPKIDGLNITLWYKNGEFYKALTRGDGTQGEDVTHTVSQIASVPKFLSQPLDCEVTGEVCILKKDFEAINAASEQTYKNPRNLASGTIRQLDATVAADRKLQFFAYQLTPVDVDLEVQTQIELLKLLKTLGFQVQSKSYLVKSPAQMQQQIKELMQIKDQFSYEIDGLALKINQLSLHKSLGHTVKCPRFACAFKFPASQKVTKILDIFIQVGRTGALTPVAILKPTDIDGSVVSRATLHNQDEIDKKDIRIGDTVILQKAGDIIPEIVRVLPDMRPPNTPAYKLPALCPACGQKVTRDQNQAALRCQNSACSAKVLAGFKHFVSKKAMNIEGFAIKTVEALIQAEKLQDISDIFTLQASDLQCLPGFADKKIQKLLASIKASLQPALQKFLFGLNIRHLGEKAASDLVSYLSSKQSIQTPYDLLKHMQTIQVEEIQSIEGLGTVISESLCRWFQNPINQELLKRLSAQGLTFKKPDAQVENGKFQNLSFVFTGTLTRLTRSDAQKKVLALGGKTPSSLSKNTSYLVFGDKAGSKLQKAKKLGVKAITEKDFIAMLES